MKRLLLILTLVLFGPGTVAASENNILVFAAASMKEALEEIASNFTDQCQCRITFSFASSGTLARQIRAGAKADLYVSADEAWVEWLNKHQITSDNSVSIIAGNRLVIVVGKSQHDKTELPLNTLDKLTTSLTGKRIAMSDITSVPAGRYGKQALDYLDLWNIFAPKLVFGENVRITLRMAARGDVYAAIVYQSDAAIEPAVKTLYRFESDTHKKITYPAVLISSNTSAQEFQEYLSSRAAIDTFRKLGFVVPADG